ncbi:MAG: LysE family transporter [Magnetospirillum sp.]|nr:LysE family transporter [Magnetospirillum sp.]
MVGELFLRGVAIGFAIAAPIGPVGILCIRKALADGRSAAFVAGLGAAAADTVFGAVVGLGLGAVPELIAEHAPLLRLVGGVFLLALGVKTWAAAAFDIELPDGKGPGPWRDFVSTFAITITNPATILGVMGVFAALGAAARPTRLAEAWVLVVGVFAGSTLWWLVLSSLASAIRSRFTPAHMRRFNHVSGAALMVFGVAALAM